MGVGVGGAAGRIRDTDCFIKIIFVGHLKFISTEIQLSIFMCEMQKTMQQEQEK